MKKISDKGIKLIQRFEGCADKQGDMIYPYICSAGKHTIGWGSTFWENGEPVSMDDLPITQERADHLFELTLKDYVQGVNRLLRDDNVLTQNMFDSLVSFAYNLGLGALSESTLLRKVNINRIDQDIRTEFLKWDKAMVGGELKPLPGLTARRKAEADNYFA